MRPLAIGLIGDFQPKEHRARFESGPFRISGRDDQGEPRVVELEGHPFYLATLFQPELPSTEAHPHPFINAFVSAAARCSP